ncbi:MAG TPA: hypothetical protein VFO58_04655 [Vicinamibacterales bacterium]|nr:hypothetical protein [Vicinamibacterales bacterium]
MSKEDLTRREFTVETALAMLAGVTITITGCSDDPSSGPSGGETGTVSSSAGHSHGGAFISDAQLAAGAAIVLTLTGSGHTHTASLTQAEVVQIAGGTRVVTTSTTDELHNHTVTFN